MKAELATSNASLVCSSDAAGPCTLATHHGLSVSAPLRKPLSRSQLPRPRPQRPPRPPAPHLAGPPTPPTAPARGFPLLLTSAPVRAPRPARAPAPLRSAVPAPPARSPSSRAPPQRPPRAPAAGHSSWGTEPKSS
jgi:hypothetical protein